MNKLINVIDNNEKCFVLLWYIPIYFQVNPLNSFIIPFNIYNQYKSNSFYSCGRNSEEYSYRLLHHVFKGRGTHPSLRDVTWTYICNHAKTYWRQIKETIVKEKYRPSLWETHISPLCHSIDTMMFFINFDESHQNNIIRQLSKYFYINIKSIFYIWCHFSLW